MLERLSENLYRFEDTCHVYVIRCGTKAVLIDFGAGEVLELLPQLGIEQVTDVIMTHHHRDQAQGLPLAAEAGARVWVPAAERGLFDDLERHWLGSCGWSNYDVQGTQRFALAASVPVTGAVLEYVSTRYGLAGGGAADGRPADAAVELTALPLPGHTAGSIGLIGEIDGSTVVFAGDLLAGPGKVWSLGGTQWSYAGSEGLAASVLSLLDLRDREPDLLLPSHGVLMAEPAAAIDLTVTRLRALLDLRGEHAELLHRRERPFRQVLPHLLYDHTSFANSYVILAESGKALVVDQGFGHDVGAASGTEPSARRPWLYSLPLLKREHGVERVDVVMPTHYHDDHVAGINLLRAVEGTQVWAADIIADVLEHPEAHDLPCLWHEPIPVDRLLLRDVPFRWEEYEFVLHHLPGHTLHAVAIEVEIDGTRVLFTGDQHTADGRLNYVYQNRFRVADYRAAGELYLRLRPELMLTGHWGPMRVDADTLEQLAERGAELERLHRDVLFLEDADFDAEGHGAWIRPYRAEAVEGEPLELEVEVRNPDPLPEEVSVQLRPPTGWRVEPATGSMKLGPGAHGILRFRVTPGGDEHVKHAIVTADLTVGRRRFGEHASARVTVR
jgi:glyoxylase-like metal-dependent hydrolase (beta-lactamase superfamily II)